MSGEGEMTAIDQAAAFAEAYLRARDLLSLERLVLAAMGPREPETRTHVMAQMGRIAALERVEQQFAAHVVAGATHDR